MIERICVDFLEFLVIFLVYVDNRPWKAHLGSFLEPKYNLIT
jgi:hypothetical protein